MALDAALAVLIEDLPSVLDQLSPERQATLLRLLEAITTQATDDDWEYQLVGLLDDHLGADHPFWAALNSDIRRSAGTLATDELMTALRALVEAAAAALEPAVSASQLALRQVQEQLLRTSTVSAAALRSREADLDQPGLLRLPGPDGELRLPAFQFGQDGRPRAVVLRINQLLYGDVDPWGVTSWWLTWNGWLEEIPRRLIGRVSDETLVAAAQIAKERD